MSLLVCFVLEETKQSSVDRMTKSERTTYQPPVTCVVFQNCHHMRLFPNNH
ncbi:hypothetical protein LINPERPRIM_LOCUS38093 [Linum perenne]